jgi:NAD-dependent deacetylase
MIKKRIVVLTGAGISAESGLQTFRDADGLWEGYNVYDVATPEAWHRDPVMVQEFYNVRRRSVLAASPNEAHKALVLLEDKYDVFIVTQNIDDLHERAGSGQVIHLHGIITKSQSERYPHLVYDIEGPDLKMGELCEKGHQLRPHVVWFGEPVPMIEKAVEICQEADILIVIGTSLQVYPAAGLIDTVPPTTELYMVDPKTNVYHPNKITVIQEKAVVGVPRLVKELMQKAAL